jgi:SAM-dependent methyltransferase
MVVVTTTLSAYIPPKHTVVRLNKHKVIKMVEEARDIARDDAYSLSAPEVLGEQHTYLLDTLESRLSGSDGNLLVLGSGGFVLPYSCQYKDGELGDSNRDRIAGMIGKGRIVLADYVVDESKNGLEKGIKVLNKLGFFDQGYFKQGGITDSGIINPAGLEEKTIACLKNNIRDPLCVTDASVNAVDANLSIHHASVTRAELDRVYREIFRVLKPGGLLHLGEGNVDMNYTEDKVIQICQHVSNRVLVDVICTDDREKGAGYSLFSLFKYLKGYEAMPTITKEEALRNKFCPQVRINEDGLVTIDLKSNFYTTREHEGLANYLRGEGYKQLFVFTNKIVLPLIDTEMDKDYTDRVDKYYSAIIDRAVKGYNGKDDSLLCRIMGGVENEQGNARRGIVEYYMGEGKIVKALKTAGFDNISVHRTSEPFYNITAVKPK